MNINVYVDGDPGTNYNYVAENLHRLIADSVLYRVNRTKNTMLKKIKEALNTEVNKNRTAPLLIRAANAALFDEIGDKQGVRIISGMSSIWRKNIHLVSAGSLALSYGLKREHNVIVHLSSDKQRKLIDTRISSSVDMYVMGESGRMGSIKTIVKGIEEKC